MRSWARATNILAVLVVLLAPVALFAPKGLVLLAAVAVVALLMRPVVRAAFSDRFFSSIGLIILVGMVWAAIASLWSPGTGDSLSLWLSVVVIMLGGMVMLAAADTLPAEDRVIFGRAIIISGILFVGFAAYEIFTGGSLLTIGRAGSGLEILNRGSAIFAIFLWPVALAIWHRRPIVAIAFLVAGINALLMLPMFAAVIAALIGAFVFAMVMIRARPALFVLSVGSILVVLLSPLISLYLASPESLIAWFPNLPDSWLHRFYIWEFTGNHIFERPLFGWGFDASRGIQGGAAQVTDAIAIQAQALPLHPHNGAIQIWLELGFVGILILMLGIAVVVRRIDELPRVAKATAAATFASWLVLSLLSFGVWQNWWLVVPWLMAAFLVGARADHSKT